MKAIDLSYTVADIEKAFDLHYAKQFPIRSKLLLILKSPLTKMNITAAAMTMNMNE